MPARERRNYRCADPNFGAQTLRYFVAKGRKGVRGYEQAHPCRARGLPARSPYQLEAGGAAEIVGSRGLLPREPGLATSEVAVGRGAREDGVAQSQIPDDGARSQVE